MHFDFNEPRYNYCHLYLCIVCREGTPGLSGVWVQNWVNSALYIAFWSVEPTDFKNVIVENIHWALSEDAKVAEVVNIQWALSEDTKVAEVKRPRNSKRRKFYYEKW